MYKLKRLFVISSALLLSACVSSTYLAKQQYILQTPQAQRYSSSVAANINVMPMLAAPPFDGVQFVYRLKGSRYLSDYYNIFMTPPADQLTSIVTTYLRKSHLFANTNSAALIIPGEYQLKTQLLSLYADYSNDQAPQAVMSVQFIILRNNRVVFHQTSSAHTLLAHKSTEALVQGWNRDIAIIMSHISMQMAQQFKGGTAEKYTQPAKEQRQYNFLKLAQ